MSMFIERDQLLTVGRVVIANGEDETEKTWA